MLSLRENALASIQPGLTPGTVPPRQLDIPWALDELGIRMSPGVSPPAESGSGIRLCASMC
jgi:hypothetical protein